MKSKKMIRTVAISFVIAALFTALVGAGILYRLDRWIEDAWYQEPRALSGNVLVIGIDEKALEQFGPYNTWTRDIMAGALNALASDPEHMPAVVAIDTLYSGESGTDADKHLADAAEKLGCVITADAAQFGSESIKIDDGRYATNDYVIKRFETPYAALKDVTVQGHINAMNDSDGILRHAILYLDPPRQDRVYSMASTAAKLFAEKNGLDITLPETNGRGMFWVSFSAMPNTYYENVSIADLYNGDVPSDYYANKVVYIGPYAAGLQDVVSTPIDRGQSMNGVEFQANVTEQILNGDYKDEVGNPIQLAILFVLVFASLVILSFLPLVPASVYAVALIAASLAVCRIAYNGGHILHPLWVPVGVFLSYVVSVGTQYIITMIEKRRVTQTFQRYVDP
ncbi:MAG: CHASE2 domain-containing protein, partial [Lachnospiraceae bacterium]|nr:CHASE2 domain-containing protein [Lachnospiraceae bacterium]